MDRLFYNLQKIISKKKLLFSLLLLVYISVLVFTANRVELSENASNILPKSSSDSELGEILENISFSDRIFFNISLTDSNQVNTDLLIKSAQELKKILENNCKDEIENIQLQIQEQSAKQVSEYVINNLPFLLTEDDYQDIDKLIEPENIQNNFKKKYKALLSPASVFLKTIILKDPVGLSNQSLQRLRNFQLDNSIKLEKNHLFTHDKKHLLFYLIPKQAATETKQNAYLVEQINLAIKGLNSDQYSKVNFEYFGAPIVAVGNAQQIKKDIILTVSMAVLAVILLIAFFYRSKRLYFIIFLPAALAILSSMSILYLLNKELSAIALGLGSVLVGISIDYVLHIFTHYQKIASIKQVLKDVSEPILISATTTATAFFGLMIVSAPALQDMGLFAGISILFAAIFSLIIIPAFLGSSDKPEPTLPPNSLIQLVQKITNYPLHQKKYILLFILFASVFLYYHSKSVSFQGDMNSINYMDAKTIKAEENLNSITKLSQRNIFVVTADSDLEKALEKTEQLETKILNIRDSSLILKHTSIQLLLPSEKLQKQKLALWNTYWTDEKKASLILSIQEIENQYHFKSGSFAPFYKLINKDYSGISTKDQDFISGLFFTELIQKTKNKYYVVTQIKTTTSNKTKLHHVLEEKLDPGMHIIDKEYLTNQFVNDLIKDFNKLVLLTFLLVFIIIWMSFGRIELALITYLPLMLSWVWTMGLMSLLGLEFNIVNIIITTFIFGLGIDYSIFITKGLIQKYKYNFQNSESFKTSILFSAITTIIGVGVLIFAKHPALQSMAAVTVIGLISVLFLSFTLQPLLFNWLVYIRNDEKRLMPITALNLVVSITAIIVFSLGSLINTIAGFLLISLTNGKSRTSRLWFHHILRASSWVMIFIMFNVKKRVKGWDYKKFHKPSVIISNHQSHIDIMLMLMLHPKIILLTNDWVQKNFFYGKIVKMADFYPILDHLHEHTELLQKKIDEGYSIMVFPEGTRSATGKIGRFHKGAFYLAEQLKLDILPIILHGPGDCITKGEPYLKNGRIDMTISDRVSYHDSSFGEGYVARSKAFRKWYIEQYKLIQDEVVDTKYMRKRVELNYIYKGPVLEWYGKIKMNFENNYQFFHEQISGNAKIIDLGCGNGFMDYMLLMLANEREIIGVDYDDDKIKVALNCNAYQQYKENSIRFETSDLMEWEYQKADVYIIMDTLHYLPQNEQEFVITQAVKHLNTNGKIIIRDADTDLSKKHKGTKFSEWLSTKVFGFNKTKNDSKQLYFSSAKKTQALLESLGLQVYIVDHTKMNSNVVLIGEMIDGN